MFDESKPLLPLGKHVKSISELITLCIENFEENTKRRNLFKSLMSNLIEPITDLNINCDIWVDGSF
ncbi:hypothetical protein KHQ89_04670 [Mycoplasmatota bacterium]|nr:hypothetical protein KHQ89_04670 [Mycoplasmatota bacterium]